ncbi:MAG: type II toxin-antitoxin system RelE/ParE family toxin [Oligoflexia bacterium]|nr:type II toxin-antitoxin system RelE/ParE family toxin [Oligoflexia bacterium]
MRYSIVQTDEFHFWFEKQNLTTRRRITARMDMIKETGNLGNVRYLGDKLLELKWTNGLRIYFTFRDNEIIILLNGGMKNAQKKDIEKARRLCKKYSRA